MAATRGVKKSPRLKEGGEVSRGLLGNTAINFCHHPNKTLAEVTLLPLFQKNVLFWPVLSLITTVHAGKGGTKAR
ncbi:MAG: hypothetical protein ACYSW0_21370 [Planctomycetota bacterium]